MDIKNKETEFETYQRLLSAVSADGLTYLSGLKLCKDFHADRQKHDKDFLIGLVKLTKQYSIIRVHMTDEEIVDKYLNE